MIFDLIGTLRTVTFSLDKILKTVRCCMDLLSQKLTASADHFHSRVFAVEIQGEYVRILIVEMHMFLRFRGEGGAKEVGSSCRKIMVHRKALLTTLLLANNHIEGRGKVISAND
jgi:hypothetical protein